MLAKPDPKQIKQTAVTLGIPETFIIKDHFITQAIHLLTRVDDDYFALIFQGGTSLSKGYQMIDRMSEDVDFRVILKPAAKALGKGARRSKLRLFRYTLIDTLNKAGFKVPEETIRVFYEGRYMNLAVIYELSDRITYLKPHIKIECFFGELMLPAVSLPITSLTKLTVGDTCSDASLLVDCTALDETAAEKWVALTRRIANTTIKQHAEDKHLVRHLYDLYHLSTSALLTGDYCRIASVIMEKDRQQFKHDNEDYFLNPTHASKMALDKLYEDKQWESYWSYFLEQMVYHPNQLSFDKAYDQLLQFSRKIFNQ